MRLSPYYIKLMLVGIFASGILTVCAQTQKLQFRPYADYRKFHYGFFFGLQSQSLQLENNGYIETDEKTGEQQQWFAVNNRYDPGFTVGLVGEWRITDNFAFRLLPTMHFCTKNIKFRNQLTHDTENQEMRSTYIAVPMHIKITPPRVNNYRPYATVGLNPMYDLTVKDQDNIKVKPMNVFFEVGFGCDRYLPYFKFIPELKFCFGLANILDTNRSQLRDESKRIFTKSVNSAHSNMVVMSFYFE